MAANQIKAPSFFNFLKEGVLLPSRNRSVFTAVSALILVSTTLIFLGNDLAVQPLTDEIKLDVKALNTTEPGTLEYAKLLQEIRNDSKDLLLVTMGSLLFALVVASAVRIVVLFAAVSTYSSDGEQRDTTFGALLGKAKGQIKGPLLTLAFVYVLQIVSVVLLVAMVGLVGFLEVKQYFVTLLVASLLVIAAAVCLVYFSFLCSFSLVVAVAQPGCHGAAALGKAWSVGTRSIYRRSPPTTFRRYTIDRRRLTSTPARQHRIRTRI
uniref:Uncharacterized protein n=1 Tax=Avena sativa TaxID=4498 RepID=A0ACD5XJT4_AVESA